MLTAAKLTKNSNKLKFGIQVGMTVIYDKPLRPQESGVKYVHQRGKMPPTMGFSEISSRGRPLLKIFLMESYSS